MSYYEEISTCRIFRLLYLAVDTTVHHDHRLSYIYCANEDERNLLVCHEEAFQDRFRFMTEEELPSSLDADLIRKGIDNNKSLNDNGYHRF